MATHTLTRTAPFGVRLSPGSADDDVTDLLGEDLRTLVRRHHLVLLRGWAGARSADDLVAFSRGLGELLEWPFGHVLDLVEKDDPADHIFDHTHVPMHWDGMYMPFVPEFQVFHCVVAPPAGDGGETTFANTPAILRDADPDLRRSWSKVTGTYRRTMEFYDSRTVAPLVVDHPGTGTPVLRYNELVPATDTAFVNHPDIEFGGLPRRDLDAVHQQLTALLHDPRYCYQHSWQRGDLVLADNFSLLHGRNAFTAKAPRHLRRVHVLGIANPHLVR